MDEAGHEAREAEAGQGAVSQLRQRQSFSGLPHEAVTAVGALFGAKVVREPYEPGPGEPVYALRHRSATGTLRLICWPSLARVDVTCGPHAWVAKGIAETEVIAGLEVIFHFTAGATMFVGLGGDVLMVSGSADENLSHHGRADR